MPQRQNNETFKIKQLILIEYATFCDENHICCGVYKKLKIVKKSIYFWLKIVNFLIKDYDQAYFKRRLKMKISYFKLQALRCTFIVNGVF